MKKQIDRERIERAVRDILLAIGEDPNREGLQETPQRVARMYEEIFSGLHQDISSSLKVFEEQGGDEMILVGDIPFTRCVSIICCRLERLTLFIPKRPNSG